MTQSGALILIQESYLHTWGCTLAIDQAKSETSRSLYVKQTIFHHFEPRGISPPSQWHLSLKEG